MKRVQRCKAGVDNDGTCNISPVSWHNSKQAEHLNYGYDRCRREAGHEEDPSLPYYNWHLPDCGSAVDDSGCGPVWDSTAQWLVIFDLVKSSGEKLDW